jgi:hypothetical protein
MWTPSRKTTRYAMFRLDSPKAEVRACRYASPKCCICDTRTAEEGFDLVNTVHISLHLSCVSWFEGVFRETADRKRHEMSCKLVAMSAIFHRDIILEIIHAYYSAFDPGREALLEMAQT